MNYKQTLLAKLALAPKFGPHQTENIAVEALGHILSESEAARHALSDVLRTGGAEVGKIARVRTQASGAKRTQPDLAGFDQCGAERVLIEAKFGARLTENQPVAYLKRLPENQGSVLLFVAPAARIESLWTDLCRLVTEAKIELVPGPEEATLRWAVAGGERRLMLTSWVSPARSHGGPSCRCRGLAHGVRYPAVARARRADGRRDTGGRAQGGTWPGILAPRALAASHQRRRLAFTRRRAGGHGRPEFPFVVGRIRPVYEACRYGYLGLVWRQQGLLGPALRYASMDPLAKKMAPREARRDTPQTRAPSGRKIRPNSSKSTKTIWPFRSICRRVSSTTRCSMPWSHALRKSHG